MANTETFTRIVEHINKKNALVIKELDKELDQVIGELSTELNWNRIYLLESRRDYLIEKINSLSNAGNA